MSSLKVLFAYTKGIRRYFVFSILCVAIETSFEVFIPLLMSEIIDVGIAQKDPSVFMEQGLEMIGCAILSLIFGLLYARYAAKAITLFGQRLRSVQYQKIQSYSFANLDHFETSSLITRLTSDVTVIQNSLVNGIRPFARGPIILILGLVMSFLINKELSVIFLFTTPILAVILFFVVRKVAPMYSVLQKAIDSVNRLIQENLTAIRAIKAFVRDEYEEEDGARRRKERKASLRRREVRPCLSLQGTHGARPHPRQERERGAGDPREQRQRRRGAHQEGAHERGRERRAQPGHGQGRPVCRGVLCKRRHDAQENAARLQGQGPRHPQENEPHHGHSGRQESGGRNLTWVRKSILTV